MTQFRMVYITTSNEEEARRIGRTLVEEKLAACVNILPAMHSIYRWQGEICEGDEAVLIAKTTSAKLNALTQAVLAQHSYDCPCVVALPIEPGNPSYFDWLSESVGERP